VLRPGATEIVVPPKAPDTVMFAAREATNFLSRVLGCKIPVVSKRIRGRTAIFLGDCEASRAAGIDVSALARDGFVVWSGADSVCIAGRDDPKRNVEWQLNHGGKFSMYFEHATAMGVYWFLEKFAGVRMYFPGEFGEIVPRRGSVKVPVGETRVKPDFTSRYIKAWDGEWFEPVDEKRADYLKTLNYMRLRLETESVPCCHGSIGFNYLRRFGKTHPEYFALLSNGERSTDPSQPHPGQLCWTSGVIEEMYQDAKSYLLGEDPSVRGIGGGPGGRHRWGGNCSGGKYVDIMPQDGFAGCLCERCKASYRHIEGDRNYATELIWGVVSNMAARLTAEGVPGTITMMSYSPYGRIPDFELPPNVEVMIARAGPWAIRDTRRWADDNASIRAWAAKLGHKVWLWNYVNKVGMNAVKLAGIPQVTPRAYATYYKEIAPSIRGAFAESQTDRYFYNYLNYYVFSKLCWDNAVDVEALLAEHHRLMFGAGATEMAKIYDALEEKWMGRTFGSVKETPLGPVFAAPSDAELWNEVYSPAFLAEFDGLMASATRMVGEGSLEARRIALVRQEFYVPLAAAAARYHDRIAAVKALRHSVKATSPIRLVPYALEGKTPGKTLSTEVRVRKDGDAFEVVFDCEEPAMGQRAAEVHDSDDPKLWKDDCVEVMMNPSGDMENYYQFVVNSEGSWSDAKLTIHMRSDRTPHAHDWNSGMEVKVDRRSGGWTALLRIPLAAFPEVKPEFRAEFARERHVNAPSDFVNMYHWSPYARGFHDLEGFGTIYDCR
jgi:hypothetical protein